ncbi:GAF domain-containing protein [Sphingomonas sp. 8AM]|uniref:GAF domain-containing protein n=1 Tax=Sphingomonas sp. 8AM TaxID=2653170 RepID=UPI0012F140A5|nr:GAF domain-containing protein [Sphingomonas sp. 8AM]VXC42514.1 Diguanylate cyclase (modular protein) [Sphingomonas sp. 8AM]
MQQDESARLQTLRGYGILDTPNEPEFDAIINKAKAALNVPIVLMSLIDEDRQWFKARVGLNVAETPRCISFCTHAIYQSDMLIIPDAAKDERFAQNPMVTGAPYIRFYAGAPLRAPNGARVGTLCVIDTRPRSGLSPSQITQMEGFAAQIAEAMNRRLSRIVVKVASPADALSVAPITLIPERSTGHTITAVEQDKHLKIELSRFWSDRLIKLYLNDLRSETLRMAERGYYKGALVDASHYKLQTPAVARGHADAMKIEKRMFNAKAAVVLPKGNSNLQMKRLANETEHRSFDCKADAMDWLMSGA